MRQTAPFPHVLAKLVADCTYRQGWRIYLDDIDRGQGSQGLTLNIITYGTNAYHPEDKCYGVQHFMPVPPAAFDERAWTRWLLDQFKLVEEHEACEFFQIRGEHPFAPNHGPGRNPYSTLEKGTEADAATSFRGTLKV